MRTDPRGELSDTIELKVGMWLRRGPQYTRWIDTMIRNINTNRLPTSVLLTLLEATYGDRSQLPSRVDFYERCLDAARTRHGAVRGFKLMIGWK